MNKCIKCENKVVEVFKTNLNSSQTATQITRKLKAIFPDFYINFDLEDFDRVLRIEAQNAIDTNVIISLVHQLGVSIELLED